MFWSLTIKYLLSVYYQSYILYIHFFHGLFFFDSFLQVRFFICLAHAFSLDDFLASWSEIALCTSSEVEASSLTSSVDLRSFLPGEHSWNETAHVSWVFNSENMGLTTIRGVLLATNYRLIFTAYREERDQSSTSVGGSNGSGGGSWSSGNGETGGARRSIGGSFDDSQETKDNDDTGAATASGGAVAEARATTTTTGTTTSAATTTNDEAPTDAIMKKQESTRTMRTKDRTMGRRRGSLIVRDQVKADKYQKEVGRECLIYFQSFFCFF